VETERVRSIDSRLTEKYQEEKKDVGNVSYAEGFSGRFHNIIDYAEDINIPSRDQRGRQAAIAKITNSSKTAVGGWLKDNKLPNDETLATCSRFFRLFSNVQPEPDLIESYLRFGDVVTKNPYKQSPGKIVESEASDLRLKAFTILMEAARERQEGLVNYNIDSVLQDTMTMMQKLGITTDHDVQKSTKELIAMFIATNLMQAISAGEK
jgi:hypothetical protein